MRAIGKGSLASILAVGLHGARMILWVVLGVSAIGLILMPLIPLLVGVFTGFNGVNLNGKIEAAVDASDYLSWAHTFVTFAVMLFVANRLLEILKTLRFGSPFVSENADRFRALGYALLMGEGAKFAFGFLSLFYEADLNINSSFMAWLAIVAVFVLAEVFREGARMKEEQDLTV